MSLSRLMADTPEAPQPSQATCRNTSTLCEDDADEARAFNVDRERQRRPFGFTSATVLPFPNAGVL
jgi:hypothetical protein